MSVMVNKIYIIFFICLHCGFQFHLVSFEVKDNNFSNIL